MNIGRRNRQRSRNGMTRAERSADARRSRAHSHLQRVRGHPIPASHRRRWLYIAATAAAAVAGMGVGVSLANSATWGSDAERGAIFVHGAQHLSAAEVVGAAGLADAGPASAIAPDAVATRLATHAWIANASALRLPTGDLLVAITETLPLAVVPVGEDAADYVVDSAGVPFAPADAAQAKALLRVVVSDALVPNQPSESLSAAIDLAAKLPSHGLARPIEIAFASEGDRAGFALQLDGLAARVLLGNGKLDSKLRTLADLLASALPGLAEATEIDLRFAGQAVLRNEPPRKGAAQAAAARGRAAPPT